ncbi:PP2C family protein-serine/threonine phosphatase [Effusibacillus consociatus]|uniref:PP2C family protein-serine/threonine phosphatase n=1 Tax=Effusibacillus consociatus TaxID=1117041 RepID=A0ABV9Q2P4_9BACL
MRTNELHHQFEKYMQGVKDASQEVAAAQAIQQMLLHDDIPVCTKLSCVGISIPAYQLSGDYYDFIFDEQNGRYWVLVGDVMGKGIPASLMMVMVRSTVRCLTSIHKTPGELLYALNNLLWKDMTRLRSFSTLFCGMFDVHSSKFFYASAGHPSPLLSKKDEPLAQRLEGRGTIIGVLKNRRYNDFSVALSKGDLIVFCTDGVLEAMNKDKKHYGYEMLKKIIEANRNEDLSDLIQYISDDVKRYAEDYRRDDVALVALRCEEGAGSG